MFAIAGVTGKTGGEVGRALLAQGRKVRALMRTPARATSWRERGADVAIAGLEDAAALARALDGGDALFAIVPDDLTVPDFHDHRRRMIDAMAAAVRETGVPRVVLLSTTAAFLPDGNGPARDLHHAEHALADTGAKLTIVRACYFQENALAALPAARQSGVFPSLLPADMAIPTVATRDVGRWVARQLVEPPARPEVIDLLGPPHSQRELAAALGRVLGRPLQVVEIPVAAQVDALAQAGVARSAAEAMAEMIACALSGKVHPQGTRIEHARTDVDEVLAAALRA